MKVGVARSRVVGVSATISLCFLGYVDTQHRFDVCVQLTLLVGRVLCTHNPSVRMYIAVYRLLPRFVLEIAVG